MALTKKPTTRVYPVRASKRRAAYVARTWPLYAMLVPALLFLAVFSYYPMYGMIIAFQKYSPAFGFSRSPFVGLANFQKLFALANFWQVFGNTLTIAITKIVSVQLCALLLALLLNEVQAAWFKRSVQTLIYLPHFLSWIVLGGILIDMLSQTGAVNQLLGKLGLGSYLFLGDNALFQPTLIVTNLWKEVGWSAIIYLAALTGIDPQLYEAAAIDGANRTEQTLHVTLPGMRSTVVLIGALSLGSVLNAGFDQVLTLYNPSVYAAGDILDTYIYRIGLVSAQFSLAAAAGMVSSILSFGLIGLGYWLAAKWAGYRIF